jgi:hypothetical protein
MYVLIGQDWKCMTTMLLEDPTNKELNEEDATILVRVLLASVKKAVGEKIVPSMEQRKPHSLTKAQKVGTSPDDYACTCWSKDVFYLCNKKFLQFINESFLICCTYKS